MKLIFATHNEGKIREMKNILAGLDFEILSADDVGVFEEPIEDGKSFADNALIKSDFLAGKIKEWIVSDDSGLCVEALDGAPGVLSARFGGDNITNNEKAEKILEELGDLPKEKRRAYFETAISLISPTGDKYEFSGRIDGFIIDKRRGNLHHDKLPYDQIFIPSGYDRTFAEMDDSEKNSISQRGEAFRKLEKFLLENN